MEVVDDSIACRLVAASGATTADVVGGVPTSEGVDEFADCPELREASAFSTSGRTPDLAATSLGFSATLAAHAVTDEGQRDEAQNSSYANTLCHRHALQFGETSKLESTCRNQRVSFSRPGKRATR